MAFVSHSKIALWTYGDCDLSEKMYFVPQSWLCKIVKQLGYKDTEDFQSSYIWDDSKEILSMAESDGVVLEKCEIIHFNNKTAPCKKML
ncbi:hypothetical protein NSS76_19575 [Bacillus sp. FSL R5-0654]|uniref:hypothetical protein n=1 Tax=Bacillus TaxID=1386 RepID=UPI0030FBAA28